MLFRSVTGKHPGQPAAPSEEANDVGQLLMTGFPGFLGSALLPRLLARRPGTDAVCLVQRQHGALARSRVKELEVTDPGTAGRGPICRRGVTLLMNRTIFRRRTLRTTALIELLWKRWMPLLFQMQVSTQ